MFSELLENTDAPCSTYYKLALKFALYDFTGARDAYREATNAAGIGMHCDLVIRYIELQALLISPIAPHWAEYIWLEVLGKVRLRSNRNILGADTSLACNHPKRDIS